MRVRISYSVDLEEVPKECSRMLQEAADRTREISEEIESLSDQLYAGNLVAWIAKDRIKKCRETLAKIDSILSDNDMIIEGYAQAIQPEGEEDVSEG